jgi:hypothetical protein
MTDSAEPSDSWHPDWGVDPRGRVEKFLRAAAIEWLTYNEPPTSYSITEARFLYAAESVFWSVAPPLPPMPLSPLEEIRKLVGDDLPLDGQPVVYRHWAGGTLQYVGSSEHFSRRQIQHRSKARWWESVTEITMVFYDTIAHARAAESMAIRSEHPAHNIAGRARL